MRFLTSILLGLAFVASSAQAGEATQPTDRYLVSRDENEAFLGFHRVYEREAAGLVQVNYCGMSYWVRPVTIAWTQLESEANRQVRIEWNWGKGWRPVCNNADKEVTLKDIGVHLDPGVVVASQGRAINQVNRFSTILRSFNKTGSESAKSSFHTR